jgi:hypothetical protein
MRQKEGDVQGKYVTGLLDAYATGGGFFLRNGASLDDATAENLKAMIDPGRNWRGQPPRQRSGASRARPGCDR